MGGGGTSGGVSFPSHIKNWHNDLLGSTPSSGSNLDTVAVAMDTAANNNPYSSVTPATTGHLEDTVDQWPMDVQAAIQNLDDRQAWKDRLNDAVTEIINNNLLDDLDPHNNLAANAESGADTNITKAQNSINTGVDPQSDWADQVDQAVTKLSNANVLEDIDMAAAISSAESEASSEIDAALTKAENLVKSSLIDPLVTEFQQKVNSRLDERKRSVSSLYADVNAVHSSAFLISQALLERDAQREVNEFDAETRLEMYREAFGEHLRAFQTNVQARAQEEIQESQQRVEFITQAAQLMGQILAEKIGYEQTFMQLHVESFSQRLQNYLRAALQNKQSDDQIVGASTEQMLQTSRTDEQLRIEERRAFQQAAASDFEARQQAEEYDLSVDEKSELWQLRIHETGSNVLAAPGGMAGRVPPRKSDASKAVGGALAGAGAGASTGAAIGSAGGPIGAGAGALIGAGLGAASELL